MTKNWVFESNVKESLFAAAVGFVLGDVWGFRNGLWDGMYRRHIRSGSLEGVNVVYEILYHIINLGGVSFVQLSNWFCSENVVLMMSILEAWGMEFKNIGEFNEVLYNIINRRYNGIISDKQNNINRISELFPKKYVKAFLTNKDINAFVKIHQHSAGAGIRNCILGCMIKDRKELIKFVYGTSIITHPRPHGYLTAIIAALFTNFAFSKLPVNEWPFEMLKLVEDSKLLFNLDSDDVSIEFNDYITHWYRYIEVTFNEKLPVQSKIMMSLVYRSKYFSEFFADSTNDAVNLLPGNNGLSAVIMAYDIVLSCDIKYDTMINYVVAQSGDSATVGCFAGCWFGCFHGFGRIAGNNLNNFEFKNELLELLEKVYDKQKKEKKEKRKDNDEIKKKSSKKIKKSKENNKE